VEGWIRTDVVRLHVRRVRDDADSRLIGEYIDAGTLTLTKPKTGFKHQ